MAVTLLSLPNDSLSLEFANDDIGAVQQAILDLLGEAVSRLHATYSQVAFGGETFIFLQEWDDPCLIASTEMGCRLLRQIERRISGAA